MVQNREDVPIISSKMRQHVCICVGGTVLNDKLRKFWTFRNYGLLESGSMHLDAAACVTTPLMNDLKLLQTVGRNKQNVFVSVHASSTFIVGEFSIVETVCWAYPKKDINTKINVLNFFILNSFRLINSLSLNIE